MNRRQFILQGGPIFLPLLFGNGSGQTVKIDYSLARPEIFPFRIMSAEPRPAIPRLQEMTAGAASDMAIIERVYSYYEDNRADLKREFGETDPQRLAALFCMHVLHISHYYGNGGPVAASWQEYLSRELSECASLSFFQSQLLTRFGLTWRHVVISDGSHGWIECETGTSPEGIAGAWEIFDSTVNVWIDQPAADLIAGGPRTYRAFYSSWYDAALPEARQCVAELSEPITGTPGTLRSYMLGMGIYYHIPPDMLIVLRP